MRFHQKKLAWACGLFLLLLPTGCRPEGIISPDDMIAMFCEFYEADACIDVIQSTGSPIKGLDSLRVYLPIVENHGYTKEVFRSSLDYYLVHPGEMERIFRKVQSRLAQEANGLKAGDRDAVDHGADDEENLTVGEVLEREIREGTEPAIELDPDTVKRKMEMEKELKKPTRKKMTRKDIKQLEEELR